VPGGHIIPASCRGILHATKFAQLPYYNKAALCAELWHFLYLAESTAPCLCACSVFVGNVSEGSLLYMIYVYWFIFIEKAYHGTDFFLLCSASKHPHEMIQMAPREAFTVSQSRRNDTSNPGAKALVHKLQSQGKWHQGLYKLQTMMGFQSSEGKAAHA
jgi:hypothetical protein